MKVRELAGRLSEAGQSYERAVKIYEVKLGPDNTTFAWFSSLCGARTLLQPDRRDISTHFPAPLCDSLHHSKKRYLIQPTF